MMKERSEQDVGDIILTKTNDNVCYTYRLMLHLQTITVTICRSNVVKLTSPTNPLFRTRVSQDITSWVLDTNQ